MSPPHRPTLIKNEELCTVGSDHVLITWVTPEENTDTSIYFGQQKTNLTRLTLEQNKQFHRAEIKNLQPSTRYWYQVESNGAKGPLNSFQTLPRPPGRYLFSCALFSDTHVAVGDSVEDLNEIYFGKLAGYSSDLLIQCILDSKRRGIDLAVMTGDLTDSASLPQFLLLRDRILPAFGNTPYLVCIGNHDKYESRSGAGLGEKGFLEYVARRDSSYARVTYGDHQFVLLDSGQKDNDWGFLDDAQLKWLEETLRKSGDRPTFLFIHHPCNGPDLWFGVKNFWALQSVIHPFPGVQGVFSGHMHRHLVTTNPLFTRNLPYVELPATVQFPCSYAIVRVYEKGFEYNAYKVSRLDLSEMSREQVILKSVGSALYTWYAFGGVGDRSIAYLNGAIHRPAQYDLSITLEHARAVELYKKMQAVEGASLAPAGEAGQSRVILGRYESLLLAAQAQWQKAFLHGVKAAVTRVGNYDVPEQVKQHVE